MRVIVKFRDDKDNDHIYNPGDIYPREGAKQPTKARIDYLLSDKTSFNKPVIELINKPKEATKAKSKAKK